MVLLTWFTFSVGIPKFMDMNCVNKEQYALTNVWLVEASLLGNFIGVSLFRFSFRTSRNV